MFTPRIAYTAGMAAVSPFRFEIRKAGPRRFDVLYAGHMPAENDHVQKTEQTIRSVSSSVGLCYDVEGFTSFHRSQVQAHGEMLVRLGDLVYGVALVKPRTVVRFGAISVSLISKTPIHTFDDRAEAMAWLDVHEAKAR